MDLSHVPEPLRSKLQAQLARLPAEYRGPLEARLAKMPAAQLEQALAKSSAMLERLEGKPGPSASMKSSGPRASGSMSGIAPSHTRINDPTDHYNQTVRRGDRPMPSVVVMLLVGALVLVVLRGFGWLG